LAKASAGHNLSLMALRMLASTRMFTIRRKVAIVPGRTHVKPERAYA
jgi:hypothetical protein